MSDNPIVLLPIAGHWHGAISDKTGTLHVYGFPFAPTISDSMHGLAAAVRTLKNELQLQCSDVAIALPSDWCLAVTLAKETVPAARRRFWGRDYFDSEAAAYRFEEWVPSPAEEFAIQFIDSADTFLVVGVRRSLLAELESELRNEGLRTEVITPFALAIAQGVPCAAAAPSVEVVIDDGAACDAITLNSVTGRSETWSRQARMESQTPCAQYPPPNCDVASSPVHMPAATANGPGSQHTLSVADAEVINSAYAMMNQYCQLRTEPWTRFAAGSSSNEWATANKPRKIQTWQRLAHLGTTALLLSGALYFAQQWRHAAAEVSRQRAAQVRLFQDMYPGAAVPVDIESRFRSELAQSQVLSKRQKQGGTASQLEAIDTLASAFMTIPPELRFWVDEIRVDSNGLFVEGISNTHSDAERLATSLRTGLGLLVDISPPRTEVASDSAISFTIVGAPKKATR